MHLKTRVKIIYIFLIYIFLINFPLLKYWFESAEKMFYKMKNRKKILITPSLMNLPYGIRLLMNYSIIKANNICDQTKVLYALINVSIMYYYDY